MGQLLYILKKYYFVVNLSSASLLAATVSYTTWSGVKAGLDPVVSTQNGAAPGQGRGRDKRDRGRRDYSLVDYQAMLSGNLLRDGVAPEEGEIIEDVNPTNIKLLGTVAGPWRLAAATIQLKGEKERKEYGSGARIGNYRIAWIGREKIVVKNTAGDRITIKVGDEPQGEQAARKTRSSPSSSTTTKKVISREEVNTYLANPAKYIYRGASFGPKTKGNKIIGYRIVRLRSSHLFYKLGARSGDVVTRVNGQPLNDMSKMLKLWQEVKRSDKIQVDLERRGKTLSYELVITK